MTKTIQLQRGLVSPSQKQTSYTQLLLKGIILPVSVCSTVEEVREN